MLNTFELNGGLLGLSSSPFHNYNPNKRVRFLGGTAVTTANDVIAIGTASRTYGNVRECVAYSPRGERSGLLTCIAATESVSLCIPTTS